VEEQNANCHDAKVKPGDERRGITVKKKTKKKPG